MLNMLKDPAKRAEWVYGQPMAPCPKCGSYNMKPQMPIAMKTTGDETAPQDWPGQVGASHQDRRYAAARARPTTPAGTAFTRGRPWTAPDAPARDCRADRALNAEMKRLWNAQTPNA